MAGVEEPRFVCRAAPALLRQSPEALLDKSQGP